MLTHNHIMQGGKYSGHQMFNLPKDYLLYIYENKKCHWSIRKYIEDNYQEILKRK